MPTLAKIIPCIFTLLVASILGACVTTPEKVAYYDMTIHGEIESASNPGLRDSIALGTVISPDETKFEQFRFAVENSIKNQGYLAEEKPPKFRLNVLMTRHEQTRDDFSGDDYECDIDYQIVELDTNRPVYSESITSRFSSDELIEQPDQLSSNAKKEVSKTVGNAFASVLLGIPVGGSMDRRHANQIIDAEIDAIGRVIRRNLEIFIGKLNDVKL